MDWSLYLSPLVRNVLLGLAFVVVAQWGVGGPFIDLLAWHTWEAGFMPWQPLTSVFMGAPQLSTMVFDWLVLFFTLGTVERVMGRRSMAMALGFCWLIGVIGVVGLDLAGVVRAGAFMGQTPLVTALITLFCFEMPNQQILLFFVIPARAQWVGWGTGLVTLYLAASYRDIGSLATFLAWGGGVAWSWWLSGGIRRMRLSYQRKQVEKRMSRFSVIEGGKGKRDDEWIN